MKWSIFFSVPFTFQEIRTFEFEIFEATACSTIGMLSAKETVVVDINYITESKMLSAKFLFLLSGVERVPWLSANGCFHLNG